MGRLKYSFDKCTDCCMCLLACSMIQQNAFNIRYAKIKLNQLLNGLPGKVEFTEHCDVEIKDQYTMEKDTPVCVQFCMHDALIMNDN